MKINIPMKGTTIYVELALAFGSGIFISLVDVFIILPRNLQAYIRSITSASSG